MKKFVILTLCALMALGMAACGSETAASAPTAAPVEATAAPVMATEAPAEPTEAPAEATEAPAATNAVEEAKELVLSLKGKPVAELYAALGEPVGEPEYASSCLVQGGQDGVLPYEGFTVYTLVQPDGTETVYDVE